MNKFIKFLLAFACACSFIIINVFAFYIARYISYPTNMIVGIPLFVCLVYYFYNLLNSKGGEE